MEQVVTFLLIGLAIFRPDPKDPSKTAVRLNGAKPGTTLYVKILQADKFIISVNRDGSKLVSFTDDRGTDFSKHIPKRFGRTWLGFSPKISKDGHSCIVEVRTTKIPKANAGQIALKANIALSCGAGEKTERVENVALKAGTTFKVGTMNIKIDKAGKPDWGNAKLSIDFSSQQDLVNIKTLEFFGPDGQKIKASPSSSISQNNRMLMKSYKLDKMVDTVTLAVTYFDKRESVVVPVSISAGIGLAQAGVQSQGTAELIKPVPGVATVRPSPKVTFTPVQPPSAIGQAEQLDPETARRLYHRKAARVVGTLNLPSEIIKELILRKKH